MIFQLFIIATIFGNAHGSEDCVNDVLKARAYIFKAIKDGNPGNNIGIIDFTQIGTLVKLNGSVSELSPGLHGFHIHEKGDIGNGCLAALGHFNPENMMHGAPEDSNRHVGDLGNIDTPATGDTVISVSDSIISLHGKHSIIGRAVVIHEKVDDLGRGNSETSKTTGNAGGRIACGVIAILEETLILPTSATLPSVSASQPIFGPMGFNDSFFRGLILLPLLALLILH
uniref:Superoxide dismutase [Cu-Zn] n=1 Tax=Heterorhabditis bacteriophora TaxID=37862 RepID=A0A1I7XSI3_HETBA